MEKIVVRKKKQLRTGIRWFTLFGMVCSAVLTVISHSGLMGLTLLVLICVPLIVLYCHEEHWSITFTRNKIYIRSMVRKQNFSWIDIQKVTSFRSTTEGETIRIRFRNGKTFQFRKEDENAEKAVRLILKHTSIISK